MTSFQGQKNVSLEEKCGSVIQQTIMGPITCANPLPCTRHEWNCKNCEDQKGGCYICHKPSTERCEMCELKRTGYSTSSPSMLPPHTCNPRNTKPPTKPALPEKLTGLIADASEDQEAFSRDVKNTLNALIDHVATLSKE